MEQPLFYWHLELSKKCALKCPRCPRTENPKLYSPTELNLAFIQNLFTPSLLAQVERILLCGGEGDPLYCRDFLDVVHFLKTQKPQLELNIVTNGSYKDAAFWNRLKSTLNAYDTITFSIDGWDQESNDLYRVNSDWESLSLGVQTMAQGSAHVSWSTILFRFNQGRIEDIRKLARQLGADSHTLVLSSLFGSRLAQYLDPATGTDPLEPESSLVSRWSRYVKKTEVLNDKPRQMSRYRELYRKFYEQVASESERWYVRPLCRFGDRALYVSGEGYLYPCSWVSHPFSGTKRSRWREGVAGTWSDSWFIQHREEFNLHHTPFADVLRSPRWRELMSLWQQNSSTPLICEQKCLRSEVSTENLRYVE